MDRRVIAKSVIVTGVSGSGKSTVGSLLADKLGVAFVEGDDFHSPENIETMRAGVALTDADRRPWLRKIAGIVDGWCRRGQSGVIACSALRHTYRKTIRGSHSGIVFVYLDASPDLIRERVEKRRCHFMPAILVDSQFAILEPPSADEDAITVAAAAESAAIVGEIIRQLEERYPSWKI